MDRYEDNPFPKIDCSKDEPRTQQSQAEECDINVIVARAKAGGDISGLVKEPRFGSLIGMPDLRTAMNQVNAARDAFMSLDAAVRKRFDNDPAQLLDFLNNDDNRDEAVKLGLLNPKVEPKKDEQLETLRSIDNSLKASVGAKKAKRSDDE